MWKVIVALILWPLLAIVPGILAAAAHAPRTTECLVAFLLLGIVGALCQAGYFVTAWSNGLPGRGLTGQAGAWCGLAAFALACLMFALHWYVPTNPLRFALAASLLVAGACIAWLLNWLFRPPGDGGGRSGRGARGDEGPDFDDLGDFGGADGD
jgi:uncharacterized membrane protein YeaQ/YmgE (transglycosylase-associated protein family)